MIVKNILTTFVQWKNKIVNVKGACLNHVVCKSITDIGSQLCITDIGSQLCITDIGSQLWDENKSITDIGSQLCITDIGSQLWDENKSITDIGSQLCGQIKVLQT